MACLDVQARSGTPTKMRHVDGPANSRGVSAPAAFAFGATLATKWREVSIRRTHKSPAYFGSDRLYQNVHGMRQRGL